MDIKIIIYFLLIAYFYFSRNKSIEKMENNSNSIKNMVKEIYSSDVKSINNLSKFSDKIQKDGLIINSDVEFKGKLILPKNGKIIYEDREITNFNKIIKDHDVVTLRSLAQGDINNNCKVTKYMREGIGRHVRLKYGTPKGFKGRNFETKNKLHLVRNIPDLRKTSDDLKNNKNKFYQLKKWIEHKDDKLQ